VRLSKRLRELSTFGLSPGRKLARKYVVGDLLGAGWEGEVYHVTEIASGIERAAKIFFPKRNPKNRALQFYARKLNRLRRCSMIIQYATQESFRYYGQEIPILVSEYVEGEILSELLARQSPAQLAGRASSGPELDVRPSQPGRGPDRPRPHRARDRSLAVAEPVSGAGRPHCLRDGLPDGAGGERARAADHAGDHWPDRDEAGAHPDFGSSDQPAAAASAADELPLASSSVPHRSAGADVAPAG